MTKKEFRRKIPEQFFVRHGSKKHPFKRNPVALIREIDNQSSITKIIAMLFFLSSVLRTELINVFHKCSFNRFFFLFIK